MGVDSPLTAIQVLYVNMICSVTLGLVLALEKPEPDVMSRPPRRPADPLLSAEVAWRTTYVTALFVATMLGNAEWVKATGGSLAQARTAAMDTLVLAQCLYCVSCRFKYRQCLSPHSWLDNPWLLVMIAINMLLQMLLTYTPGVVDVFNTAWVDGNVWGRILLLAFAVYFVVEAEKQVGPRYLYPLFYPGFARCWAAMPRVRVPSCACACCRGTTSSTTGLVRSSQRRLPIGAPPPAPSSSATAAAATTNSASDAVATGRGKTGGASSGTTAASTTSQTFNSQGVGDDGYGVLAGGPTSPGPPPSSSSSAAATSASSTSALGAAGGAPTLHSATGVHAPIMLGQLRAMARHNTSSRRMKIAEGGGGQE